MPAQHKRPGRVAKEARRRRAIQRSHIGSSVDDFLKEEGIEYMTDEEVDRAFHASWEDNKQIYIALKYL